MPERGESAVCVLGACGEGFVGQVRMTTSLGQVLPDSYLSNPLIVPVAGKWTGKVVPRLSLGTELCCDGMGNGEDVLLGQLGTSWWPGS